MRVVRRGGWVGLAGGAVLLLAGLALTVGSAIAAGDWWLAPEPWIGAGLTLLVLGLAATAVFALLLDVVEPVGRWRLLAVPPALFVGFFWIVELVGGMPTTGPGGGPEHDVGTILYSLPQLLILVLAGTILMALPLAVQGVRMRSARPGDIAAR